MGRTVCKTGEVWAILCVYQGGVDHIYCVYKKGGVWRIVCITGEVWVIQFV